MSKKLTALFAIFAFLCLTGIIFAQAPMQNFCMQPPFSSRVLKPNVLLLMDTSGSMRFRADANPFNPASTYYGYFDSTKWYTYNTGATTPRFEIVADKASTAKLPTYWDGNFMNWAAMRRMDVVKKVLIGGKLANRGTAPNELLGEFQDCPTQTENCNIPKNVGSSLPIVNGASYVDQTQTGLSATTTNITPGISNTNATRNINMACSTIATGSATSATLNWTLAFTAGTNTNPNYLRDCAQVDIRTPAGVTTTVKPYGTVDPGSANILTQFNTGNNAGGGNWVFTLTERNVTTPSCNGTTNPTLTASNIGITVVATDMPTTTSLTFDLLPGASNGQSIFQVQRNPASCSFLNYNVRILTPTEPTGIIQATDPDIRFGLEFYETVFSGNPGGRVIQPVLENLKTTGLSCLNSDGSTNNNGGFVSCIEKLPPNGGTPLGESIWSGIGYFAGGNSTLATVNASNGPRYATTSYPVNCQKDAFNFLADGGTGTTCTVDSYAPCAKSYILAVTDGEPTGDNTFGTAITNLSSSAPPNPSGYAGGTSGNEPCPLSAGPVVSSSCAIDNVTLYGLYDPAATSKIRDIRKENGPAPGLIMAGNQNVTSYLVLAAFGSSGGGVLNIAARNGGFVDGNSNGVPDVQSEFDADADGNADNFFNAQNGQQLEDSLTAALNDILKRAGSASANSVIGAGKGQGANLLQAFFFSRQNLGSGGEDLTWIGVLNNFWFQVDPLLGFANIREDTCQPNGFANCDGDDILNVVDDHILNFKFNQTAGEASVERFNDSDGDGLFTPADKIDEVDILESKPIWEAGLELFKMNPIDRRIFTTVDRTESPVSTSFSLTDFKVLNRASLYNGSTINFLQATSITNAEDIIEYTLGFDDTIAVPVRNRTTTINGVVDHTWKLGDIIDSTAQIVGPVPLNDYHRPEVYSDQTYRQFINSNQYKERGFAFGGANDGMLHAFFVGRLNVVNDPTTRPNEVAELTDPLNLGKGKEQWAYIPGNALPYLRYLMDPNYCHLFFVNSPPHPFDASISVPSETRATYPDVVKFTNLDNANNVTGSSWRTIVIGSMGLGGGCGCASGATNCVASPYSGTNPKKGLSSYFALDITDVLADPTNTSLKPILLWEFTHPSLGYTTAAPAVVKISARTNGSPDKSKSGHWFVIIGSGPTGDVEPVSHQFRGRSNQTLKYFVINLKDGHLETVIDTGIADAFSGSLSGVVDSDKDFQDEVVYAGFIKKPTTGTTWNQGGVLRIVTHEDPNPTNWDTSLVMNDIGPVATKVASLVATIGPEKQLFLYFGTGRYFFKDTTTTDDSTCTSATDCSNTQRTLFGIKEPCFDPGTNKIDDTCNTTVASTDSGLHDATTAAVTVDTTAAGFHGFFINLDRPNASSDPDKAERLITDPEVSSLGVVFFTTFAPSNDPCTFGGKTFIWALRYDTGGSGAGFLYGFALVQTSTGAVEQKKLSDPTTFNEKQATNETRGRRTAAFTGQPPREGALTVLTPPPFKTVLRIKEQ